MRCGLIGFAALAIPCVLGCSGDDAAPNADDATVAEDSATSSDSRSSSDAPVDADAVAKDSASGVDAAVDSGATPDVATDGGDVTSCPAPPAGLPSGPLTRNPTNPLLRNGPEAYDDLKTGPRVVLKVGPSDYRIWYEAVSSSGITAVAYAASSDGIAWTKKGVVMSPSIAWEKSEVSPNSIVREGGVFKLWYHGGGYPSSTGARLGKAAIGYATSADGLTWTKHGPEVLDIGASGAFDDSQAAEPRVFAISGGYRMYYTGRKASTSDNALGVATSTDGIVWTKSASNPILDATRWGHFWGGAFFVDVRGTWHLWHGVQSGSSSSLEYMWSLDGLTWTAGPSGAVLSQSTDASKPDYGLVGDSVSGYLDGSQFRIMYTGFNSSFGALGRFEGICMAWVNSPCP